MWQSAIQTVISAIYVLFASPIAGAIGPGDWYVLGAGLSAVLLVVSIFLVPETRYDRSLAAYGQATEEEPKSNPGLASEATPVRMSERSAFNLVRYKSRTIWTDMRLFSGEADWWEGWYTFFVGALLDSTRTRLTHCSTPSRSCCSRMYFGPSA